MRKTFLSRLCLRLSLYPCLQPFIINFFPKRDVVTVLLVSVGVVHPQIGKEEAGVNQGLWFSFQIPLALFLRIGYITTRLALLVLPWKEKVRKTFYLTFSFNLFFFILNLSFSFLKNFRSLLSASFPSRLRGIRGYK